MYTGNAERRVGQWTSKRIYIWGIWMDFTLLQEPTGEKMCQRGVYRWYHMEWSGDGWCILKVKSYLFQYWRGLFVWSFEETTNGGICAERARASDYLFCRAWKRTQNFSDQILWNWEIIKSSGQWLYLPFIWSEKEKQHTALSGDWRDFCRHCFGNFQHYCRSDCVTCGDGCKYQQLL